MLCIDLLNLVLLGPLFVGAQHPDNADLSIGGLLGYPGGSGIVMDSFVDSIDGSYESTALLAVQHWNEKNDTIVREIKEMGEHCDLQLTDSTPLLLDTVTVKGAVERMWLFMQHTNPKAILGPLSPKILSTTQPIADTFDIPMFNHFLEDNNPNSISITLTGHQRAKAIVDYLRMPLQRRNDLGMLYQRQGTSENNFADNVKSIGREHNLHVTLFPVSDFSDAVDVLKAVKDSGLKTLYIGVDSETELTELAGLLDSAGLLTEDYVYIMPQASFATHMFSSDPSVLNLFKGAFVFDRIDPYQRESKMLNSYLDSWRETYGRRDDEYPAAGASFVYDAIIAMGFALCHNPQSLIDGLRSTNFKGASGTIRFTVDDKNRMIRDQDTILVGSFNIRGNDEVDSSSKHEHLQRKLTAIYKGDTGWRSIKGTEHIYRSGLPFPPQVSVPRHSEITEEIGLIFIIMGCIFCVSVGILVLVYRKEAAVRRTQPFYLFLVCLGCMLSCGALLPLPSTLKPASLSTLCMGLPMLFVFGSMTTSSALFTKAWRVYQATKLNRVRRPNGLLVFSAPLIAAFTLLLVWTLADPLAWDVSDPGNHYCTSKYAAIFTAVSAFSVVYMEVFALLFAWRTQNHNIPCEFQDNGSIICAQSVRVYTLFLGSISYAFGMRDQSRTTAYFIWHTILGLIISLAPLFLIVLPRLAQAIVTNVFGTETLFKNTQQPTTTRTGDRTNNGSSETNNLSLRNLLPPSIILDPDEDSHGKDSYFGAGSK